MNIVEALEISDYSHYTITKKHYLNVVEFKRIEYDTVIGHWFEKNGLLHGEYKCWWPNGTLWCHHLYLDGKLINNFIKT